MNTKQTPSGPQSESVKAAGDFDPGFGINGLVKVPAPDGSQSNLGISGITSGLTSEADSRIYVCGYGTTTYIIRLLQSGEIDTGFGDAGYLSLPSGNPETHDHTLNIRSFIRMDSGKIIGWGDIITVPFERFNVPAAVCFTEDGVLDTSFGDQGIAIFKPFVPKTPSETSRLPEKSSTRARALNIIDAEEGGAPGSKQAVRLADGKLLLLGSTWHVSPYYHIASYLIRINLDGSLDTDFGQEGVLLLEDPNYPTLPEFYNFDIDRRGGIVVTGTHFGTVQPLFIARYDAEGHVDRSFGKHGVVYVSNPYGYACNGRGVIALVDGSVILIAAFFVADSISQHPAVIKLLPNGNSDPDFNNGEPVLVDLTPEGYFVASTANMDDGNRIIIGGGREGKTSACCISRLMPNGALDTGFGSNGVAVFERFQDPLSTAIQNRVDILVVTYDRESEPRQPCIFRVSG